MNALLIGKFPPCQGGVSSRYFWLYSALEENFDFSWHAITINKIPYITETPSEVLSKVTVLPSCEPNLPWFIPKVDLMTDRLINTAITLAQVHKFNFVEVNYLEPFLCAGWAIAKLFQIPLVVRPAGSDYHKFLTHPQFSSALKYFLQDSSMILLPHEKILDFREKFPQIENSKISHSERYCPNPNKFCSTQRIFKNGMKKIILLVGKINQFWYLRRIDLLYDFLRKNPDFVLRCWIDGSHCSEFVKSIEKHIASRQLEINIGFIPPNKMPQEIRNSVAVWNYIAPGGIVDFPNTHWETLAANRYSIVSSYLLSLPDANDRKCEEFFGLIVNADVWDLKINVFPDSSCSGEKIRAYFTSLQIL